MKTSLKFDDYIPQVIVKAWCIFLFYGH